MVAILFVFPKLFLIRVICKMFIWISKLGRIWVAILAQYINKAAYFYCLICSFQFKIVLILNCLSLGVGGKYVDQGRQTLGTRTYFVLFCQSSGCHDGAIYKIIAGVKASPQTVAQSISIIRCTS